jgi:hypothetical protein
MAASTASMASAADSPKAKLPAPEYRLIGTFAGNAADAVSFHIWDCAGQPVFNALHSLFMSGRVCEVRGRGNRVGGHNTPVPLSNRSLLLATSNTL